MPLKHLIHENCKITFADNPKDRRYSFNRSKFTNPCHLINFIALSYLTCLNKIKKNFRETDLKAAQILREVVQTLSYGFCKYKHVVKQHLINQKLREVKHKSLITALDHKSPFDILLDIEKEQGGSLLSHAFNFYQWTLAENLLKNKTYVQYSYLYSRKNPLVMMAVPGGSQVQINNGIRISSYIILLKNLLHMLDCELFELCMRYLIGIDQTIKQFKLDCAWRPNLACIRVLAEDYMIERGRKEGNSKAKEMEKVISSHHDIDSIAWQVVNGDGVVVKRR